MNGAGEPLLDISEFRCVAVKPTGVVVVFEQTNRRYTFPWRNGELGLAVPAIEGPCDPHPVEIIDCLARAVAHHAASNTPALPSEAPAAAALAKPPRSVRRQLADFLLMRG